MKNLYPLTIFFILLNILVTQAPVSAQGSMEVSESRLLSEYFDNVYGADERLVSGPFYYGAIRGSIQGHPYYFDEDWKTGSVEIGDVRFDNLLLKYDISIDQFILKYITTNNASYQVGLRSGNITKIIVGLHTFVPLPESRDTISVPFAELLSDGKVQYMVTKSKYLVLTNGSGMTDYVYKENLRQYLYTNNQMVPFRGKKALFNLYPELKAQLKQYARKNGLVLGPSKLQDRAKWIDQCNYLLEAGK